MDEKNLIDYISNYGLGYIALGFACVTCGFSLHMCLVYDIQSALYHSHHALITLVGDTLPDQLSIPNFRGYVAYTCTLQSSYSSTIPLNLPLG